MKSVLEVIQATTGYFQKAGVSQPRLNIEHLLAHVLGKKRMDLYLEFDRPLSEAELEPLRALVKRRAQGEPLQHLLGTVEFHGRIFKCDARALVPRPETEQLCERLVGAAPAPPKSILDVGTGSGVIALTLAATWPDATLTAVDLSEQALALARENAAALGLEARVRFMQGDLLDGLDGPFDLIVANLPYISEAEIAGLAREVRFDPMLALSGGPSGWEVIERLIVQCPRVLTGRLALEIGWDQSAIVSEILARENFQDIQIAADYEGRQRFAFAQHG